MSDTPIGPSPNVVIPTEAAPIQQPKNKEEAKALFLSLSDRGVVNQRLNIPIPDDMYGEWVYNDPIEINRFQLMGFREGAEFAEKSALHGRSRISDVVFMIAPKFVKEAIDEVTRERFAKTHGSPNKRSETKEARDLAEHSELPVVNSSSEESIGLDEIRKALDGAPAP